MGKKWINLAGSILGISAFLYVSPSSTQAEGDFLTNVTDYVEIEVLSTDESKANILDVELGDSTAIEVQVATEAQSNLEDGATGQFEIIQDTVKELKDVVDDKLDVEVLPNPKTDSAVVEIELTDTLVDEVNVEVLPDKSAITEGLTIEESAVVDIELKATLVDDVNVEVLPDKSSSVEGSTNEESAVADMGLTNDLLGDTEIKVLYQESSTSFDGGSEDSKTTTSDNALIEGETEDLLILQDIHVGVLDNHFSDNQDEQSTASGVVQVDLSEGILDETEVNILVRETFGTEEGTREQESGLSLDIGNNLIGSPSLDILTSDVFAPVELPDAGEETPNPGTETPDTGEETPTPGTETPDTGNETPTLGTETPDTGEETDPVGGTSGSGDEITDPEGGTSSTGESTLNLGSGTTGGDSSWSESLGIQTALNNQNTSSLFQSNYNAQNQDSLPKTGGLINGTLLFMIALLLLVGGVAIRKMDRAV